MQRRSLLETGAAMSVAMPSITGCDKAGELLHYGYRNGDGLG